LVNSEPFDACPWSPTDGVQCVSRKQSFGDRLRPAVGLAAYLAIYSITVLPISPQGADLIEREDVPNITVTEKHLAAPDELLSSKIPLPASDIPLSAERLTSDMVERIGFRALGPLLQASTSAIANPAGGGAFNEILLRGFGNAPVFRNGLNDSAGTLPIRPLANVESIEVLKGPYGALWPRGSGRLNKFRH
jgi:outer membrane receptor protein involved in Fe transport